MLVFRQWDKFRHAFDTFLALAYPAGTGARVHLSEASCLGDTIFPDSALDEKSLIEKVCKMPHQIPGYLLRLTDAERGAKKVRVCC